MSSPLIQLLVLAGIAIFLILRLRGVLGTRDGFETPPTLPDQPAPQPRFEVIEGTAAAVESDVADHTEPGTPAAEALNAMRQVEPSFTVGEFLGGSKHAYEMILMAFERGDIDPVLPFLSRDVAEAFQSVIDGRADRGETVEAQYLGTRETALAGASFDRATGDAEISVRFVAEMIVAVRDERGEVIDGDPKAARKQRDTWTFARCMGSDDPNWQLVATG
ncbi:Tim44/TimA family putative adaptor protein [Paracoccus sp. S-4012]|uniref:Tim44/TimA family putative adaptor protein n=1 Tax=Paracoccus sp. S-4012 TaxID=2665648 RepID=UPI0012B0AC10|nr:Tim44/TimA family putative adaptor protein [Paracoccus sp. S-4012]MRX49829.1 Tim44/TimA family putative adaptor protein [Paracoccus sp. S-4012]